jgi:hypothetical protein
MILYTVFAIPSWQSGSGNSLCSKDVPMENYRAMIEAWKKTGQYERNTQ